MDPEALRNSWLQIRKDKRRFVPQGAVRQYPITVGQSAEFATSEFFGCTIITVVQKDKIQIAHISQESGKKCPLSNRDDTSNIMLEKLEHDLDMIFDASTYVVIAGSEKDNKKTGVQILKHFFISEGVHPENLRYIYYSHDSSLTQFQGGALMEMDVPLTNPRSIQGLSLFKWTSPAGNSAGMWEIYLGNETPRLRAKYNEEGRVVYQPDWLDTGDTTKGYISESD